MASRQTLTRSDQVFDVLADGGYVRSGGRGGLLRLLDKNGAEVAAWQQAIRYGLQRYNRASDAWAAVQKEAR